jgi:hypothetical protein
MYYEQVKRFVSEFESKKLKFLLFEKFVDNPVFYTQKVFSFLGVDDSFVPNIEVHNPGRDVWSPRFQYWVRQYIQPLLNSASIAGAGRIVSALFQLNQRPPRTLDARLRADLLEKYSTNIERTGELIGRDLKSIWL